MAAAEVTLYVVVGRLAGPSFSASGCFTAKAPQPPL